MSSITRRRSRWSLLIVSGLLGASSAQSQMPGAPVLQNSWAAPGIVVAGNIAGGSGSTVYAGAVGWAPSNGRFHVSGGAGMQSKSGAASRGVYGARLAVPLKQMMSGKVGIAGFAGIGGGPAKAGDTTSSTSVIPAGLAIGYRQAIGTAGRGFSAYVDPGYQYHTGSRGSKGYIRVGGGLDAGITPRFGLTVGFESGAKADIGQPGPRGGLYGVGISMKLGG